MKKMKRVTAFIAAFAVIFSLTACTANKNIAVAAYADDALFRQYALGILDEAERSGYDNIEFIGDKSGDTCAMQKQIKLWAERTPAQDGAICILARDPAVLGICEELKAKGFAVITSYDELALYHEYAPVRLSEEEVPAFIDCLVPYDEAGFFEEIAAELAHSIDGKEGSVVILHGHLSEALYDGDYFSDCLTAAMSEAGCDLSAISFARVLVEDTQDGVVCIPCVGKDGTVPDLRQLRRDAVATLSMSTLAAQFACESFPDAYNAAFIALGDRSIGLYESGALDSLYCLPMYDTGRASAKAAFNALEGKGQSRLNYVPVKKYSGEEKQLAQRFADDELFDALF